MTQKTAKSSGTTLTALRLLAKLCTELWRPATREEWDEALESQHIKQGAQQIKAFLEQGLAEEWRGSCRVTRKGIALLKPGGLEGIEPHDTWALGDDQHHGPLHGPAARQVSRLEDLSP